METPINRSLPQSWLLILSLIFSFSLSLFLSLSFLWGERERKIHELKKYKLQHEENSTQIKNKSKFHFPEKISYRRKNLGFPIINFPFNFPSHQTPFIHSLSRSCSCSCILSFQENLEFSVFKGFCIATSSCFIFFFFLFLFDFCLFLILSGAAEFCGRIHLRFPLPATFAAGESFKVCVFFFLFLNFPLHFCFTILNFEFLSFEKIRFRCRVDSKLRI